MVKQPKGEKFRFISLDKEEAAIILSLVRQAQHADVNTEQALEIIETLEVYGNPMEGEEERAIKAYEFPEEVELVISLAAYEYLPKFMQGCSPQGFILKQWKRIKQALKQADRIFDKTLMDKGWKREDEVWFPAKDANGNPILLELDIDEEKPTTKAETSKAEVESEAPSEEPVGAIA